MKNFKKILSFILAIALIFTLMPSNVQSVDATSSSNFLKIFQLDAGRRYFSVSEIEGIIDQLAANSFDALELAIGNNGLRFLLDDMSIENYSSEEVKSAIKLGNSSYTSGSSGELSQNDMNTIISYAKSKGIQIIPLVNTPGHMSSIVSAMRTLGITTTTGDNMLITNDNEISFVKGLLQKYINYFADKGSEYFNMGADEYSFSKLSSTQYQGFVNYINDVAGMIKAKNMNPMAFNDGIYYKADDPEFLNAAEQIDKSIIIAYWTQATNYASVTDLNSRGFKLLNNNDAWYYVLGDALYDKWATGQWGYEDAKKGLQNTPCDAFYNTSGVDAVGSVLCVWCDYPEYNYDSTKVYNLISTMVASNPIYFTGLANIEEIQEKTIYVTVGKTATDTISGTKYDGTYTTEDASIATVSVTSTDAVDASTSYKLDDSVTCENLISSNSTSWKSAEGYYCKVDDNYYPIYAKRSPPKKSIARNYNHTWGYETTDGTIIEFGNQTTSTSTEANFDVYTKTDIAAVPASTTITFNGNTIGETTVVVGNIKYTIKVINEDLNSVSTLPIQLWITNSPISVTNVTTATSGTYRWNNYGNETAYYIDVNASNAYGEDGIELSSLAPAGISQNNTETSSDDVNAKYVIWKGTVLNRNSSDSDFYGLQYIWTDNKSYSGSDFTYIRYYEGAWAVSADRNTWTVVTGQGSTGNVSSCQQQIIAYYMQRTEITEHVITDTVDYGDILSNQNSAHSNISNGNYVILDYSVKYPTGQQVPNTFRQDEKTLLYHCAGGGDTGVANSYRRLNAIRATETSSYEVYMITITPTSDTTSATFSTGVVPTTYSYDGTERVIWAESEDSIPDGYTTIEDLPTNDINYGQVIYGGEPEISELNIYNRQGMLVTYYIRGKQTSDSLQVQYVDDSTGETFYTTNIPVINEGDAVRTFNNGLFDSDGNIYQVSENTTLDDNKYYVTDSYNTNVYIRSDLTKIVDLHGVYTTGIYNQVKAEISIDNPKILILHYVADRTLGNYKNFVVDFGLPVEVKAEDLFGNIADISSISKVSDGAYGEVTTNGTTFTYTPFNVLQDTDIVTIKVTFSDNSYEEYKIGFAPATTVYYEEGFANYTGTWSGGTKGSGTQATQIAGQSSDEYGYDSKYASEIGKSNGTQATATTKGDNATFEFTGTGVDVYANCSGNTGKVTILVSNSTTGKAVKLATVDTTTLSTIYEDYSKKDEYSLPILSLTGLDYDTYTVKIVVVTGDVHIDGFRVYNTLANEPEFYKDDKEDDPTFIELRDEVLDYLSVDATSTSGQVYTKLNDDNNTDGVIIFDNSNKVYTDEEKNNLLNNGPKNELFLLPQQTITFKVNTDREVQIGLKAPVEATSYSINNGENTSISTSTDMFYTVGKGDESGLTVTIKNNGNSLLSITKVKVCDDPDVTLGTLTEDDINSTLIAMGIVEEEPEVEYADAKLTVKVNDKTTVLTANGVVGETNTFTASEIQKAAESLVADGYTLKDVKYKDVSVTYGEESTVEFTATKEKNSSSLLDKIVGFIKWIFGR